MGRLPSRIGGEIKKGPWTPEEDLLLSSYIQENDPGNWTSVSINTGIYMHFLSYFINWYYLSSSDVFVCVLVYMSENDNHISMWVFVCLLNNCLMGTTGLNRSGKSCRLRWINYLRPGIKQGTFTSEEERKIIQLHAVLGNKYVFLESFVKFLHR